MELRDKYGTTILLTTHLMEEVEFLCDRMAIMNRGKLVAIGTADALKATTGDPEATLDDVFIKFAGGTKDDEADGFRQAARARRTARRLG